MLPPFYVMVVWLIKPPKDFSEKEHCNCPQKPLLTVICLCLDSMHTPLCRWTKFIHYYYLPISHEVKEKFLDVSATIKRLCFYSQIAKCTERNIGAAKCILTQTAILIQVSFKQVVTGTWCKADRHHIAEPCEDGQNGGYKEKQSFEEWRNSIVIIQTPGLIWKVL